MYVARQGSVMMAVKLKLCQITGGKGGRYYNILHMYIAHREGRKARKNISIRQARKETSMEPKRHRRRSVLSVYIQYFIFLFPPFGAGKKHVKASIPQSWEPVQYCIHTMQEVRGAHILRKDET